MFELTNHLGIVLAVINDRKIYNSTDQNYEPVMMSWSDFYAGGMLQPGRHSNSDSYRYLFNGMEHDGEISGSGNSYTTEFRQYDPRLMRWKSMDPLMAQFPWMSPYVAFDNNPVVFRDPLGLAAEGGGEPIKKEGNRYFNDKKATESELKDLPDNPVNQETVVFEYDNAVVTYKYVDNHPNQNGIDGYWDAHVTGTTPAGVHRHTNFPVSKKAVVIAKTVPPSPELNNGGVTPESSESQAGQETHSSSNTSGSSSSGSGTPPRRTTPPSIVPPPITPPPPPDCFGFDRGTNLNLNIGFQYNQSRLRNENATRPVMRAVADVILANPWSFINLTYNFIIPNGSWDALNPKSGTPPVTNDVIGRNRARRLRSMLIEFGVQPNRIGIIRGNINGGASVDGVIFRRIQIPCD